MGDSVEIFRALADYYRERRARLGIDCPGCKIKEPKRNPTKMMPGRRCKVCGYRDPRPEDLE
jgi:thioesterase domain-containing protein